MIRLQNIILFVLLAFSGVYVSSWLIKPSYVAVIISFFILTILTLRGVRYSFSSSIFILIAICVFYTIFNQFALEGELPTIIFYSCLILIPLLVSTFKSSTSKSNILLVSYIILIIYYSFETFIRITNPDYSHLPKTGDDGITSTFYIYKINSIAFEDSNFISVILVVYYISLRSTALYSDIKVKYSLGLNIGLLTLILLTFSRSAYIGVLIFECMVLFFFKPDVNMKLRGLLVSIILVGGGICAHLIIEKIASDPSFISKFYIVDLTVKYLSHASTLDILFGIGFGNAINVLGMGAHNIFIAIFIENGLIGTLLYLYILIMLSIRYKLTMLLIIPISIMGLSFSQIAMPYFYVVIAWLIFVNEDRCEKISKCCNAHL
ncbi:O37 family O-antigen polymerase [Escherichia coli]|uniref:O37 family O-antigen polymerase n=1 Tax=Escherichia coli TaxID=562 RepID=UPI0013AF8FAB|nr:O37 family O-antigen polymerase [Escherichia coli]EGY1272220.1 O37 family O-antigen polymerase [Escherichia coli]EJC0086344.1 O37 family O-antigen polymerase [Escherichia coli]EKG6778312.1 O37 family O-antigen polymerase [Escherichia coli]HDZ8951861.1 O37 family O-antigen polymerase [Escherichia coli]